MPVLDPNANATPPQPGDAVPWFRAPIGDNPRYQFSLAAGRYVLMAFLGPAADPASRQAWRLLADAQAERLLDDRHACAFVASIDPADDAPGGPRDILPGLRLVRDRAGRLSQGYGALEQAGEGSPRPRPTALLLDPMLRVMHSLPLARLGELLDLLRRLPEPALHAGQDVPAPVLLLPRVLAPETCQAMVAEYEAAGGGQESGFMLERDGKTVGVVDPRQKRRRDHEIRDPALRQALEEAIGRRLAPLTQRAFQFTPTRIERHIVACYDAADGGHFRAHRDNTTPGTAHRRFAVTINLNEEFEGGDLWFPEFGPRRYRAPLGGAVVFSCSLLHEATPVTAGRRFATLPFLYDEAGEQQRLANLGSLAPG